MYILFFYLARYTKWRRIKRNKPNKTIKIPNIHPQMHVMKNKIQYNKQTKQKYQTFIHKCTRFCQISLLCDPEKISTVGTPDFIHKYVVCTTDFGGIFFLFFFYTYCFSGSLRMARGITNATASVMRHFFMVVIFLHFLFLSFFLVWCSYFV